MKSRSQTPIWKEVLGLCGLAHVSGEPWWSRIGNIRDALKELTEKNDALGTENWQLRGRVDELERELRAERARAEHEEPRRGLVHSGAND